MSATRARDHVYLIGIPYTQILGAKLPSKKQVLSVFFYNHRVRNLPVRASAGLVVDELCVFWGKALIPVHRKDQCIDKVVALHDNWRKLQKHAGRQTEAHITNEKAFVDDLENLFDVATVNALDIIQNDEDKQFLILQRQPGRPGSMIGIDAIAVQKEKRRLERMQAEAERKRKADEDIASASTSAAVAPNIVVGMRPTELSEISSIGNLDDTDADPNWFTTPGDDVEMNVDSEADIGHPSQRGKINFINERIVSALDKCKVSDRYGMHLLIAIAEALGHDVNGLIINRTSLRRARQSHRELIAAKVKNDYKLHPTEPCVVHFDGKILPEIHGKKSVDRLPVSVSNKNGVQLLGIPRIPNGTGQEQSAAVFDTLHDWGLVENVQAICCDTTAANTGRLNGACTLLQQKIGRSLLMLPCRHHIFEIVLKSAFDVKMGATSAPVVLLFKRFQAKWGTYDENK